jgi:hypothetical protein
MAQAIPQTKQQHLARLPLQPIDYLKQFRIIRALIHPFQAFHHCI